jgi:hypothetical protein
LNQKGRQRDSLLVILLTTPGLRLHTLVSVAHTVRNIFSLRPLHDRRPSLLVTLLRILVMVVFLRMLFL